MHTTFVFAFAIAGVVNQLVTWLEIEPVLRRLGYKFEEFWLGKYKGGLKTLWEYKKAMIAEQKPLTRWWIYWASLWIAVAAWVGMFVITDFFCVKANRNGRRADEKMMDVAMDVR